jgi:hypothetical protein
MTLRISDIKQAIDDRFIDVSELFRDLAEKDEENINEVKEVFKSKGIVSFLANEVDDYPFETILKDRKENKTYCQSIPPPRNPANMTWSRLVSLFVEPDPIEPSYYSLLVNKVDIYHWLLLNDIDIPKNLTLWVSLNGQSVNPKKYSAIMQLKNNTIPNYLNCDDKNYSPRLAAAVNAWIAISETAKTETRFTPKQQAIKWLEKTSHQFNNGKPLSKDAIAKIAQLVNWKPRR